MVRPALALAAFLLASAPPAAADGFLDTTFSGDGKYAWNLGGSVVLEDVVASDAHVYAIGAYSTEEEAETFHVLGLNNTAGASRICITPTADLFPFSTRSHALTGLLTSDGDLMVAGFAGFFPTIGTDRALVAKFDFEQSNCQFDTGFSGDGWTTMSGFDFCASANCAITDLVETSVEGPGIPRYVALVRVDLGVLELAELYLVGLTETGAVETGFGDGGASEIDNQNHGFWLDSTARIAVDGVGSYYVAGTTSTCNDLGCSFFDHTGFAVRISPTGDPDLAWASEGYLGLGGYRLVGFDLDSEGGFRSTVEDNFSWKYFAFPASLEEYVFHGDEGTSWAPFAVASDGTEIVARDREVDGSSATRLAPDWAEHSFPTDLSFGVAGFTSFDFDQGGDNSDAPVAVALMGGRPVIAGNAAGAAGSYGYLVRFTSHLIFNDGFEIGSPMHWSWVEP